MKQNPLVALSLVLAVLMLGLLACDLGVQLGAVAGPSPVPPPGTLVSGGAITPEALMAAVIRQQGEEHVYTFQGEAGLAVTIQMNAGPGGTLDSYLELRGPDGSTLVTNDDGGASLNSLISNFVLPVSGEYTVVAHGFNHRSTGGYNLIIALGTPLPASPTPSPTATPRPGGGPIALGAALPGDIRTPGQVDAWEFTARAGDIITVDMRQTPGSYLDPYVELIGPDEQPIIADDDSGSGSNARLSNIVLTQDGTYTLLAQGYGTSVGGYEITLSQGQPPTPVPPTFTPGPSPTPNNRPLVLGEPSEGVVSPGAGGDEWWLEISRPVAVEILVQAVNPTDLLYVDMFEPGGTMRNLIGFNNPSDVLYLPGTVLARPGVYTLRILNHDDHALPYTITITATADMDATGGMIGYDQGVSGELLFAGQQDYWTFDGLAGDVVTISLDGVGGLDGLLILLDPNGSEIARDDDSGGGVNSMIESYRLPQDGEYTIIAGSYRNNTYGPYRLRLFLTASAAVNEE
ncbi:MAG: PPC domain-containing protein [Anaerolineae bacterium]|nr:PPC domain-containing protein [Anaerolineae bacterium]